MSGESAGCCILSGHTCSFGGRFAAPDVWYSTDGDHWTELPDTPWIERHAASVFVLNGKLFMTGGTPIGQGSLNDVWQLERIEPPRAIPH